MKHTIKITITLITMFLVTQLIGLYVINSYTPVIEQQVINGNVENVTTNPIPYGMEPPEIEPVYSLSSIIISFAVAIVLIFLLMKFKAEMFIRVWFFVVVILAVGLAINPIVRMFNIPYAQYVAAAIALPLAIFKIFKRNIIVHNITELLIYPGIAAVFVPILNIWTVFILLILISIYDMWAVWHSGFMQKMAKFQMDRLKIFTGFFVPYFGKAAREKIKKIKMSKGKKKDMKVRVNVAILGGGDVVFPIIAAGVLLRSSGLIQALMVTIFATIALLLLLIYSQKGKFYPAMPFITAGCIVGLLAGFLF